MSPGVNIINTKTIEYVLPVLVRLLHHLNIPTSCRHQTSPFYRSNHFCPRPSHQSMPAEFFMEKKIRFQKTDVRKKTIRFLYMRYGRFIAVILHCQNVDTSNQIQIQITLSSASVNFGFPAMTEILLSLPNRSVE